MASTTIPTAAELKQLYNHFKNELDPDMEKIRRDIQILKDKIERTKSLYSWIAIDDYGDYDDGTEEEQAYNESQKRYTPKMKEVLLKKGYILYETSHDAGDGYNKILWLGLKGCPKKYYPTDNDRHYDIYGRDTNML